MAIGPSVNQEVRRARHCETGYTDEVKQNLEEKRVSTRKYPNIIVGDNVRLYHKKKQLDKERVALWSDIIYKVDEIVVSKRQKMYKINNGKEHRYMRHELLKIE